MAHGLHSATFPFLLSGRALRETAGRDCTLTRRGRPSALCRIATPVMPKPPARSPSGANRHRRSIPRRGVDDPAGLVRGGFASRSSASVGVCILTGNRSPSPRRRSSPHWTTVRFPSGRCPIVPTNDTGQLSDFLLGAVQRGWKLPWNQSVRQNRPIGADCPRFQVQLDRIGQLSTNFDFLYTGMPPHRPVQIRYLISSDARVPIYGGPHQPAGAIFAMGHLLQVAARRSLP